jgi:hypothetical protein
MRRKASRRSSGALPSQRHPPNQARAVNAGDLKRAEGMLMIQAHTLDAIFNTLALQASRAKYMDEIDRYLRLGLKA